jgi:hypothetical protein
MVVCTHEIMQLAVYAPEGDVVIVQAHSGFAYNVSARG